MGRTLGKIFANAGGPPEGWFVAPPPTGSATGDGSFLSPWTLQVAMDGGYPLGTEVQPGDTVWLRGGTYTGQFSCGLKGTAGNLITFRGYPGERATIDGPYNNDVPVIRLLRGNPPLDGEYIRLQDLEITNSLAERIVDVGLTLERGDAVTLVSPHSEMVNCIIHDNGEGWQGPGATLVYGNLFYYNGEYAPIAEQNHAAAVDLAPSGGTAVATSGTYTKQETGATSITLANHNNTGDYTLVAVAKNGLDYTTCTASFDSTAMTLLTGKNGYSKSVAVFGLAGHTTTANVTAQSNDSYVVRGIAQSFVNVGSASAGGNWYNNQWNDSRDGATVGTVSGDPAIDYDIGATTSTDTNHMVVDGMAIFGSYSKDVAPSGDNTGNLIGGALPASFGSNPMVRMSTATRTGAGTVNMQWGWTMLLEGHGHGAYVQNGFATAYANITDGQTTLTTSTPENGTSGQFRISDEGAAIRVVGAGPGGTDLVTTVQTYNANDNVTLAAAASTTVVTGEATCGRSKIVSDNIYLNAVSFSTQVYGSSGAACVNTTLTGNLHTDVSTTVLGGLSGFRMTDSSFSGNYTWDVDVSLGYQMTHLTNFDWSDNYFDDSSNIVVADTTWEDLTVTGNTFIGAISGFDSTDFPTNEYDYVGVDPTTNVVVVRPNTYEANRANVFIYNWEDLDNVSVDLDSAVADGTPIYVLDAQNYYGTPVLTTTYTTGVPISVPMAVRTRADVIGSDSTHYIADEAIPAAFPRGFKALIVRAQSAEAWRT